MNGITTTPPSRGRSKHGQWSEELVGLPAAQPEEKGARTSSRLEPPARRDSMRRSEWRHKGGWGKHEGGEGDARRGEGDMKEITVGRAGKKRYNPRTTDAAR